jgi:hypothetical protein
MKIKSGPFPNLASHIDRDALLSSDLFGEAEAAALAVFPKGIFRKQSSRMPAELWQLTDKMQSCKRI